MSKQIHSFRVSPELWERLDVVAQEFNVTKTSVIIDALEYLLERVEGK